MYRKNEIDNKWQCTRDNAAQSSSPDEAKNENERFNSNLNSVQLELVRWPLLTVNTFRLTNAFVIYFQRLDRNLCRIFLHAMCILYYRTLWRSRLASLYHLHWHWHLSHYRWLCNTLHHTAGPRSSGADWVKDGHLLNKHHDGNLSCLEPNELRFVLRAVEMSAIQLRLMASTGSLVSSAGLTSGMINRKNL